MILEFEDGKDAMEERDQLLLLIHSFVEAIPSEKLTKDYVYVKTLSELFRNMRQSRFSDEEIDDVIFRAAVLGANKKTFTIANSNNQSCGAL